MATLTHTFFKCALCSQLCTSKQDLSEHMSLHLGNKKYCCDFCGKKFFTEQSLELHIRIHAKEIKYEALSTSEEQMMLSDNVDNQVPQVKVRVKSFPASTVAVNEPHVKNIENDQMHFQLKSDEFSVMEESEVYTTYETYQEKKPVQLKVWSKDQNYSQGSVAGSNKAPYIIRIMDTNQQSQGVVEPETYRGNDGPSQLPIKIFVGSNIKLENLEDLSNLTSLTEEFKQDGLSPVVIGQEQSYDYSSYEENVYQEESQQNQPMQGIKEINSLHQIIEEGDLHSLQEELGSEHMKSLEETMASVQPSEGVMANVESKSNQDCKDPLVREVHILQTNQIEDNTPSVFTYQSSQLIQKEVDDGLTQSSQSISDVNDESQKSQEVGSQASVREECLLPLPDHTVKPEEVSVGTEKKQLSSSEVNASKHLSHRTDEEILPSNDDEINVKENDFKTEDSLLPVDKNKNDTKSENEKVDIIQKENKVVSSPKTTEEADAFEFKRQILLSSKRPHRCHICGLGFRFSFYLKAHQAVHLDSNQKFSCEICGKGFKSMDSYERHQEVHDNLKSFQCPECMKKLNSEQQLKRHIMIMHNPLKQHECHVCFDKFSTRRLLKSHLKCHTVIKCHICDKVFKENNKLKRHLTTHLNKKIFTCSLCGRTLYCHPLDFEYHKMLHQDVDSCSECFRKFPLQGSKRHEHFCCGKVYRLDGFKENSDKKICGVKKEYFNESKEENRVRIKVAGQLIDDLLHDMAEEDMQGSPFLCDNDPLDGMTKENLQSSISGCNTKDDVLRELSLYLENDIIKEAVSDCLLRERVAVLRLSHMLVGKEKTISSLSRGQKRKRGYLS